MKGKKLRSRKGQTEHEQVPLQRPSTETVQEERVCYSLLDHNEQDVPKSLLVVSKETFNLRIIRKVLSGWWVWTSQHRIKTDC